MTGPPFDLIIFDCDSTLTTVEGVDELAARRGVGAEVSRLTAAAMDGAIPLEEAYLRRFRLIGPEAGDIEWLGQRYRDAMVPGAARTISTLSRLNKEVHVISGGVLQAVLELARALSIPDSRVHAVKFSFDAGGRFLDVEDSPLTRTGGKAQVLRSLLAGEMRVAAVGDGASDLELREAGAAVIGFGGVVERPIVAAGADCYVRDTSLDAVLPHLLTKQELASLSGAVA